MVDEGRPGLETMVLLSVALGRQLLTDPVVSAGIRLTTDVSLFDPPVSEPYEDWLHTAESLFRRAVEEGDLRPDLDTTVLASVVVAAYTGVQLVSESLTHRADLFGRVKDLWTVLLPGIVVASERQRLEALPELVR